jgi:hypothetical protein
MARLAPRESCRPTAPLAAIMIRAMGSGSHLKSRAGVREGATQALVRCFKVRASIRPVQLAVASTMTLGHEHLWDECDTLTRVGRADRAEFDAVDANAPRCLRRHRLTKWRLCRQF